VGRELLVVGARGRVGREVVRALAERGASVRVLHRAGTPAPPGGVAVTGDLRDPPSLRRALDGVTGAFFVTPHAPDEEQLGRAFVEAATAAKISRLVFSAAFHNQVGDGLALDLFVAAMGLVTHYGPKLRVEKAVRRSGLRPVVLLPSNFYQNDELFLGEIRAGRYPQPLGLRGTNRVDCRDIGDAAARALTDDNLAAGAYAMVGPDAALTGPDCAAEWAAALDRPVEYDGDLDRWRALVAGRMPDQERQDFGKTYRIFSRLRVAATPCDLARTTEILGRPPCAYAAYVRARSSEFPDL
jgi:uncharacterized protein YbjT (DUF2867 family)